MSYQFDSIVNRQEANALKEMIFNRVKERSQSANESIQADIMELARNSFVSQNNPFSTILSEKAENQVKSEQDINTNNNQVENKQVISNEQITDIGFPQKQFAPRAVAQNREINYQISSSAIYNNMAEARDGLKQKKGFIGALEFLNAQAAVSLARVNRTDRFEMVV